MKPNRMAGYGLLLILLFVALEYVWMQTPQAPGKPDRRRGPRIVSGRSGCPADPQQRQDLGAADWRWTLKKLDGEEISFSQFRRKVIFLNVWATWCGPCRREMPEIEALQESLRGENIEFVLVSEEELDPVKEFVAAEGLSTPVYISASPLPEVFESRGIPATFLIDPQGDVVFRRTSAAGWNNDTCRDYLRALLKTESAATGVSPAAEK